LKALLADIGRGLVDVVVVYKVDRLTRSLADFAKIVELFDGRGVSFVSVTQAFNTTTSMGRLTLNVLLSFAQFEREVTGERIRDKIAASKAKGLRMGGRAPLGYDIIEGRLAPNASEADRVKAIFQRYLEVSSLNDLAKEAIPSKRRVSRAGNETGGVVMCRSALNHLLRNPAYVGITCHKEKRYEGTHPGIVPQTLFDQVQAKLDAVPAAQPGTPRVGDRPALEGRIFDDRNYPMVPVHTNRHGQRYRYYISKAKLVGKGEPGSLHRISAGLIEQFLSDNLQPMLASSWTVDGNRSPALSAVRKVTLSNDRVVADLVPAALRPDAAATGDVVEDEQIVRLTLAFEMRKRQGAWILQAPGHQVEQRRKLDRALIRAVVLAKGWAAQLEVGDVTSIKALAACEAICDHYAAKLLPLAYLAPDLTEAILDGRQGAAVSLAAIIAQPLPRDWDGQRSHFRRLGMPG
jgi:site-specific DNA recombinase